MGPPMGRSPIRTVITSHDTATLTFNVSTGMLWWKVKAEVVENVFADNGHWYYRAHGNECYGWAGLALERSWRLYRREEKERNMALKAGEPPW